MAKKAQNNHLTKLSDSEEKEFRSWYSAMAKTKGLGDDPDKGQFYDYRGFWKNNPDAGAMLSEDNKDLHFHDTYKQPGHPTFSKQSIYSTKDKEGGEWIEEDGASYFKPSKYTMSYIDRTHEYLTDSGEGYIYNGRNYMPTSSKLYKYTSVEGPMVDNDGKVDWDMFERYYRNINRASGGPRDLKKKNLDVIAKEIQGRGVDHGTFFTMMGNLIDESGGNPRDESRNKKYFGLFQWGDHLYPKSEREKDKKLSDEQLIKKQINKFFDEVTTTNSVWASGKGSRDSSWYPYNSGDEAINNFLNGDNLWEKTRAFVNGFERTGNRGETIIDRYNTARLLQEAYDQSEYTPAGGGAFHAPSRYARPYKHPLQNIGATNEMAFGGTTQSEAQDYVYNKLVDEYNFTPVQAVGIVANLTYESGLNPTIVRKGGKDFGLQQWVGDRRKNLYAYAKRKGHEIPTFDDQLEYVVKEYRGDQNSGWTHINKGSNLYKKDPEKFKDFDYYQYSKAEFDNSNSISDAVVAWNQGFGRPPKEYLATDRRIKIGKDLAARYGIEDSGDIRYAEGSVGGENTLPEIEIAQARPAGHTAGVGSIGAAPASFSYGTRPELQSDMDRWMEDYGKDLAAQLLNTNTLLNKTADILNRNKEQEDLDNEQTSEQIKQASQDQQLRAFISELIPSMQMKYKGVAKSNS